MSEHSAPDGKNERTGMSPWITLVVCGLIIYITQNGLGFGMYKYAASSLHGEAPEQFDVIYIGMFFAYYALYIPLFAIGLAMITVLCSYCIRYLSNSPVSSLFAR